MLFFESLVKEADNFLQTLDALRGLLPCQRILKLLNLQSLASQDVLHVFQVGSDLVAVEHHSFSPVVVDKHVLLHGNAVKAVGNDGDDAVEFVKLLCLDPVFFDY